MTEFSGIFSNGRPEQGAGTVETVTNPSTADLIVGLAGASPAQVDATVVQAQAAFSGWSAQPPRERSVRMLRIADRIDTSYRD